MQLGKARRRARRATLQVLYAQEYSDFNVEDIISGKITIPDLQEIDDYAVMLLRGIPEHAQEIDKLIDSVAHNWTTKRMSVVDKLLLRMAVYEMKHVDDVPVSVSINEAVEIAKEFGCDEQSHKFINGILGKISRNMEEDNE